MNIVQILTALLAAGGLTFALATLLVISNRLLYVPDDPRVEQVVQMLPGTNCGGCGYPGCRPFALALVAGEAQPARCNVGTASDHACIASFLGVDVGEMEKRVARLACAGGINVARNHARYQGLESCAAATLVAGGGKGCTWGCLGLADCHDACTFDAIQMNVHRLPVVDEARCTACGDCVAACPKDLFSLEPMTNRLWVACRSQASGDEILEDCEVACTACGRCAADAPELITMQGNLPVIDRSRASETRQAIERCPTGAIVWWEPERGQVRGAAARQVIRHGARRDAPT